MKLNLRKARKLESQIQNYLDENTVEAKASIRTQGSEPTASQVVASARKETLTFLKERESLLEVRYGIRRSIEKQNEDCGINKLLNKKVFTEKLLTNLKDIDSTPAFSKEELSDQIDAHMAILKKGDSTQEDLYGRRKNTPPKTSFKVPVFSEKELEGFEENKIEHKRTLEDIDDKLSAKNITEIIVLSKDSKKLLESHRLL